MENQIKLRWTSHQGTVLSMLDTLLSTESMVDVTLACDGQYVRAHKVVLSACSPYFQELFSLDGTKNSILYLRGVQLEELKALIHYMYRGEVSVAHEQLSSILEIAKELKIRGLADVCASAASSTIPEPITKSISNSTTVNLNPVTVAVPVSAPPSAAAITSTDSSASSMPSISTPLGSRSPFVAKKHITRLRPTTATLRRKSKADYTQRIQLKGHPHTKMLGPGSTSDPLDSGKPRAPSYDPAEDSSIRTEESIFEPSDHQSHNNGDEEQLQSFFNQTDDRVKVEVLEGFQSPEVVEIEDDDSMDASGTWDQSMGLGSVEYPSLPTSAIYRPEEDGECGNEMPMLTATNTGVVGPNVTKFFDENRNKRSGVWQHFTTITVDGDGELYSHCNYCDKKYKRSTSTTNMKSHLRLSHQLFF